MTFLQLRQKSSFKKILLSSFIGVYSHVFLDSFLYSDVMPFHPLQGNPFINIFWVGDASKIIYGFCGMTGILGIIIYWYRIRKADAVKDKPTLPAESEAKEFRTQHGDKQGEEVESSK